MRTSFALLFVAFTSILCHAGGTICSGSGANPTILVPDGRVLNLDVVQPNSTVYYIFTATSLHSYSIEVHDDLDAEPNSGELSFTYYQGACVTAMGPAPGTSYTGTTYRDTSTIEPAIAPTTPPTPKRISIPSPTSGAYSIKVVNTGASAHYVSISISETTLFNPRWSTYSTFGASWALRNTTSSTINEVLTITYQQCQTTIPSPNPVSRPSNGTTTPITANTTIVPSTGDAPALQSSCQGSVSLTHDGPPGAIVGDAVGYNSAGTIYYNGTFLPIRQTAH